jgi:hypothetical protein
MKRKRTDTDEERVVERPFVKREELLNVCLQLNLKYNTELNMEATDLSLYRYAETIQTMDQLRRFTERLNEAITERKHLKFIRE